MSILYGSLIEDSLLFLLVIAGASSTDIKKYILIKERLMVMENILGFRYISRARELLETV